MRFGIAVQSHRSLYGAVLTASELECESLQVVLTDPKSFKHDPIDEKTLGLFAKHLHKFIDGKTIVHTPYGMNLATPDEKLRNASKASLLDALERARIIGMDYVITHIGTHRGVSLEEGVKNVQNTLTEVMRETDSPATIVLEPGAGGKDTVGATFDQLAMIMDGVPDIVGGLGVCLDTAHLWAAGYEMNSKYGTAAVLDEYEKYIGFDMLKVVHLNDTLMGLGFNKDRHYDIAMGKIGPMGFKAFINSKRMPKDIPGIIETPPGDSKSDDKRNLDMIRSLVVKKKPKPETTNLPVPEEKIEKIPEKTEKKSP